ncbi:LysR family transcriptional regulator [Acuticoccus sp. MNP-M23]|uniref:LysR family transcriptional regulator n=1 Tax=Acuticoccus sp. MNP-M23 TaxID=3072793 RepID=UPI002816092F|nr:LysR family transcriptional regulator [Acuticoccus sp. MNP-M23]WMS42813.1 LysR family transcriptional regulator [Acuticoccus sp. MNP-M23]
MDRLTSMGVFVKAVDLGSFASAASATGLSAQMVAKHVARLEDRLGTTLLNRTTRRQNLTDVGRAYYERCKHILAETEAADAIAQEMHRRPHGLLRISAPVSFGTRCLGPVMTAYLARHEGVETEVTLSDRYVDAMEDGFDVLIRIGAVNGTALIATPLRPYKMIACASPAYVEARGMPQAPSELAAHDCLDYAYWSPSVPCRWVFSRDGTSTEAKVSGRLRSNDWGTLLHAAREGFGIVLGPELVLADEISSGRLVRVLPHHEGPARPMNALTPANRRPTAKVRTFVDALVAAFG